MPTSGSINLTASRDEIITEALELLGVLAEGDSPTAAQLTSCARTMNYMIKAMQADGLNLYALQLVYLFLQEAQSSYSLLSTGADHYTASFVETTTSAASISGATTLTVTSITGLTSADKIGAYQDDGSVHWTTINGAPSGSTVTLTAALTAAVSSGAVVYAYTTRANRPMRITEVMMHDFSGNKDLPVTHGSREEYFNLTDKNTDSTVNKIYYDPQVAAPKLFVWPQAGDERDYLKLYIQRTLEDVDTAADLVDYPQEWFLCLAYNLALLLSSKYGKPIAAMAGISAIAELEYKRVKDFDVEPVSVFLAPRYG